MTELQRVLDILKDAAAETPPVRDARQFAWVSHTDYVLTAVPLLVEALQKSTDCINDDDETLTYAIADLITGSQRTSTNPSGALMLADNIVALVKQIHGAVIAESLSRLEEGKR